MSIFRGGQRSRSQCPECNLLTTIDRLTVVDDKVICLRCAGEDAKPWFVQASTEVLGA